MDTATSTVLIDGHTYHATAKPGRTARELIVVYRDGEPWDQRETTRVGSYDRVHLLGGFTSDPAHLATEYSGRVRPVGSGGKHGTVRGSVLIQRETEERAACANCERFLAAPGDELCPACRGAVHSGDLQWPAPRFQPAPSFKDGTVEPRYPATEPAELTPLEEGELAELIRTKLASEERHTAELERLALIAAQTQAALVHEIQAAGQAGLTNRAIARASGLSHPTVAKILSDPAKYGGGQPAR